MIMNCSEKREPLAVETHPDGWADSQSENFHALLIDESPSKYNNCATCHGNDFKGGTSKVSCSSENCHNLYPHEDDFVDEQADGFHGNIIAKTLNWQLTPCIDCHGDDFKGEGNNEKNCFRCHQQYPHSDEYVNAASEAFHGLDIANALKFDISSCTACHGNDYEGKGYEVKNCRTCHEIYPHAEGFANPSSDNFHSKHIATEELWDISGCRSCHGEDYSGSGYTEKNCLTCHTQDDGPEACNTCHGNALNSAPPKDLADNSSTDMISVGAHQAHLIDTTYATSFVNNCTYCHIEPQNLMDAGHIDNVPLPAEVHFSLFASDSSENSTEWDHNSATCSDVYCHGAFSFSKDESDNDFAYADSVIVGNNPTMIWNSVGTGQDDCGTCHDLPPKGHIAVSSCNGCHPRVVDANYNIIDKQLHINGKKDVY